MYTCAEIAAKQGHGDVSKLTPTDIAIEVLYHHCSIDAQFEYFCPNLKPFSAFQALLQIGNFVTEHPTIHGQVGDLQVDSQSRRIRTLQNFDPMCSSRVQPPKVSVCCSF